MIVCYFWCTINSHHFVFLICVVLDSFPSLDHRAMSRRVRRLHCRRDSHSAETSSSPFTLHITQAL
jgi:hypothetical protein